MLKMALGSSDTQASSVASLADSYSTAFNNIISAVDSLGNSDKLKGSAYTNVKTYTRSVVTPLAKGMILLADAAKADTKLLPDRYRSDVGEDDLSDDTEVLAAEIAALDATINANNTALGGMEADDPNKSTIEGAVKSDTAERDKRQKKLNKINAYDAASPSFFSDIAGLEANLNSGLSLLQSGVAGFTVKSGFPLPSKKALEWTKTINSQWEKREAYQAALAKVNKGEALSDKDVKAIEAYQKAHPNIKLNESTKIALKDHAQSKKVLAKAKEAHKKGEIDDKTYQSIKSGIINFGAGYVKELIQSKVTDKAVESFTKQAISWLSNNINATQVNVAGALSSGGIATFGIDYNPMYASFIRGAIKYGIPVVGALVDFGMQKAIGESTGDALIKTGGHVAAGLAGAKAGAVVGTFIGGPVGTAIGGAVGFGLTVAGSMVFDAIYDNKDKIADGIADTAKKATQAVEDTVDKVGDAISGFGKTLGSVFG